MVQKRMQDFPLGIVAIIFHFFKKTAHQFIAVQIDYINIFWNMRKYFCTVLGFVTDDVIPVIIRRFIGNDGVCCQCPGDDQRIFCNRIVLSFYYVYNIALGHEQQLAAVVGVGGDGFKKVETLRMPIIKITGVHFGIGRLFHKAAPLSFLL